LPRQWGSVKGKYKEKRKRREGRIVAGEKEEEVMVDASVAACAAL